MGTVRSALGWALFAVGCSAAEVAAEDASAGSVAPVARFARDDVESDLALELTQALTAPFEDGRDPRLEVTLANRSLVRSYAVVLPDDGSESGWREPRVGFSLQGAVGERMGEGEFVDIASVRGARCGVFAEEWQRDVRVLGPGERVRLEYFPFDEFRVEPGVARVRIVAHYSYGERARDPSKVPTSLRVMPRYALASNDVELAVARPYELVAHLTGTWPDDVSRPLADHFAVLLKNQSNEPLPYEPPDRAASLFFELALRDGSGMIFSVASQGSDRARDTLLPGETRSLLGPEVRAELAASAPPRSSVARFRVRYEVWFEDADSAARREAWGPNQHVVWSDWVSLD